MPLTPEQEAARIEAAMSVRGFSLRCSELEPETGEHGTLHDFIWVGDLPKAFEAADRAVPVTPAEEHTSDVVFFWEDRDAWRERAQRAEAAARDLARIARQAASYLSRSSAWLADEARDVLARHPDYTEAS